MYPIKAEKQKRVQLRGTEKGPIIAKNVSHDGTLIKQLCSEDA